VTPRHVRRNCLPKFGVYTYNSPHGLNYSYYSDSTLARRFPNRRLWTRLQIAWRARNDSDYRFDPLAARSPVKCAAGLVGREDRSQSAAIRTEKTTSNPPPPSMGSAGASAPRSTPNTQHPTSNVQTLNGYSDKGLNRFRLLTQSSPRTPPPKVARPVPSPAAEENPTSADWAARDSGGKVDHENITVRFC
jgi:hypothetical protein